MIPVILGATAVGKSGVAIELAKRINGEIISCDSRQIYKFMDIVTAKPEKSELNTIRHYLIDIVEPDFEYSAAIWVKDCVDAIEKIKSRGKIPIICGGTFFYIKALRFGFDFSGEQNIDLRNEFLDFRKIHGNEELYRILTEKNPKRAAQLHPNDINRIIRALQIENGEKAALPANEIGKEFVYFVLSCSRKELYERVNLRVDKMVDDGLFEEYKKICEKYPCREVAGRNCVGYREFDDFMDGKRGFDESVNLIKQHSRNYAKRQISWLRNKEMDKIEIDAEKENWDSENLARLIGKLYFNKN